MKKRLLALLMTGIIVVGGLAGCGTSAKQASSDKGKSAGYAKDAKLKIWGSQEDQEMYRKVVEQFKNSTPEAKDWTIDFGVVQGAKAKEEILKDPSAAADIFDFASDQIQELKKANVLYRITKNKDKIISSSLPEAVKGATIDGELYGYPLTNTTFVMFYDKSMYTEDEVKNLNTMMEKKLPEGVTNFSMDIDNGWFNSCFFQGVGCRLFGQDGLDPTKCDFNNQKGLMAGNYMANLAASPKFANQDGPLLLKAFENKKLGATFQGIWDAEAIKGYLGKDYGVTKLPEVTLEDGSTVQLASMMNFNLTGINAQTKYPAEAMLLAEYLTTNKDALKLRSELRPQDEAAKKAADEQAKLAVLQTSIPQVGNFWPAAEAFGAGLMDKTITKDNMKEKLDLLVKNILAQIK
ncbi:extracellular solute-binding protein [Clostridium sp. C2-6-12]|uniref:extracellular solute-binding protein n=1 Tax=Clostridium sp. C2-6-12 TaxID=2698832 RepID=UPI00137098F9|nr:extracellular solute-binding protein [Clostridium sp. C2-6-12]